MSKLTHDYTDLGEVRLHYVSSGNGKLILLLHGFPEFWYAWKTQLGFLGDSYMAVAPDMRGYNLSSKPSGLAEYRLKKLVDDVLALASYLKYDKFVLAGHDWGGLIAWAFAVLHPERLEKLVVINAPHPAILERELKENKAQRAASSYFDFFNSAEAEATLSANGFAFLIRATLDEGLRVGYFKEEDVPRYLEAWSRPGALTAALNYYRASLLRVYPNSDRYWSFNEALPDATSCIVNVPTLVIWGMQDKALLPGNLDGIEQFVPEITIRRFADAGHWIIHSHAAQVSRCIAEFVA